VTGQAQLIPTAPAGAGDLRALSLRQVRRAAEVQPLPLGDRRYAELRDGFRWRAMLKMRDAVGEAVEDGTDRKLKIAFVGHRGAGKTTELYRLEGQFKDELFPIHVFLDENLLADCDYSLLMLQMCEQLCLTFDRQKLDLNPDLVEEVGRWFAQRTESVVEREIEETRSELTAKSGIGFGVGKVGAWLLAQVRQQAIGDQERRSQITMSLRRKPDELVQTVNRLLDEARRVLAARPGLPSSLLIVHDNYDRLERSPAQKLFFENSDLLHQIDAACIFTAPVTARMAPHDVSRQFGRCYILYNVKLHNRDGTANDEGIQAMRSLLEARVDTATVFDGEGAVATLVDASGGSARDLMRLLGLAAENASVDEKPRIDLASAKEAVRDLRNGFSRGFMQHWRFFPLLANIHRTKTLAYAADTPGQPKEPDGERQMFEELLGIGAVFEFNGGQPWYDVHPVILEIEAFKEALAKLPAP